MTALTHITADEARRRGAQNLTVNIYCWLRDTYALIYLACERTGKYARFTESHPLAGLSELERVHVRIVLENDGFRVKLDKKSPGGFIITW